MASLSNYTVYRATGSSNWQVVSTNNNTTYVGKDNNNQLHRTKIEIDTTGMNITSSGKLSIKIKVEQSSDQVYNYLRARLTTTSLTYNNIYNDSANGPSTGLANATIIKTSVTTDSGGTSSVGTGYQDKGTYLYLVFDTSKNPITSNTKYYIYLLKEDSNSSRFNAFSVQSIDLEYISYTSCKAPDNVTASGIISPNGTFTVNWSGAAAGAGQVISGYDIYYRITSEGSEPTISTYTGKTSISSDLASGSTTITISKAAREHKIVCGVVTKGSAGATYYSSIKTGGSVTINNLPTQPSSIAVSSELVPSTGGVIIFTPKYIASEEGQENSVWYSSSSTGSKTKITGNSINLEINNNIKTYYFWTYDGLEYSSNYTSKTISINTKPTCSVALSGSPVVSAWSNQNASSSNPYIIAPTLRITNGNNGQNDNKYDLWIQYSDFVNFSTYSEKQIKSNHTSLTYSITNIRKELPEKKPPYYYRVAIIRKDGIEDSNKMISNQIYYVNNVPMITNIFNNGSYKNITDLNNYFDKKLGFYFDYDESYSTFTLSSGKKIILSHDSVNKRTYGEINDAGYSSSGKITINGYYDDNNQFIYTHNTQLYKVESFDINNLVIDDFIPWNGQSGSFSITNRFQEATFSKDTLKRFGVSSINECFKYFIEGQASASIAPASSSNNSTLFFTPIWNVSGLNTDTNHTKTITVQFINKFGTISTLTSTLSIIYKVTPIISTFSCNQTNAQLKQNQDLKFTLNATNCYNSEQKAEIYVIANGIERLLNIYSLAPSNGKINITLTYTLGEIKNEEIATAFRVKIINKANTTTEKVLNGLTIKFLKHTIPNVSLTRTDYQNNNSYGTLNIYFDSNKWGLGDVLFATNNNTIKLTVYKGTAAISNTITLTDKNASSYSFNLTGPLGGADWETVDVSLKVEVTNTTNSKTTTYTQATTNTVIVYNLTPTVAYRKNYLGINTKTPESEDKAIIVIGNSSGRNQIVYKSGDPAYPVCILTNFKIDGGTW